MPQLPKILFVSHDANRAGAQLFLLNIMTYFKQKNWELHLLLLENGSLLPEFSEIATVHLLPKNETATTKDKILSKIGLGSAENTNQQEKTYRKVFSQTFDFIYINTIACVDAIAPWIDDLKGKTFLHIHEMELSVNMYSTKEARQKVFSKIDTIIACSNAVAKNLKLNEKIPASKIIIIHSFVDNERILQTLKKSDKESIKQKYRIPTDAFIVGGCGNAEPRKGVDIFIQICRKIQDTFSENIKFVWVGIKKEGEYYFQTQSDIHKLGIQDKIILIEPTHEAVEIINCFDIFCLSSREDPFPLVMLEAALAKKAIIGMENSGGVEEFAEEDSAIINRYLCISEIGHSIAELFEDEVRLKQLGKNAQKRVLTTFNFENSIKKIEFLFQKN